MAVRGVDSQLGESKSKARILAGAWAVRVWSVGWGEGHLNSLCLSFLAGSQWSASEDSSGGSCEAWAGVWLREEHSEGVTETSQ